jgi:hypothetical protein
MDVVTEAKSEQATPPGPATERRKGNRLLAHWQELRDGRPCPSLADVDPAKLGHLWRYCFIAVAHPLELRFAHIGEALRASYGVETTGGMPPTVLAMIEEPCRLAFRRLQPVVREGMIHNPWGDELRYRAAALPLSEDQETASHLLGLVDFITVRRELAPGITVETQCAPAERAREPDA